MLKKLRIDPYLLVLVCTVAAASLLPARGVWAHVASWVAILAIALLFFLYGARLSPQAAFEGLRHWRLHLLIVLCTFVLFPVLGLLARPLVPAVITPALYTGFLYLCALPSTVQSSIAFTSIARGNIPAALCAASASNLVGVIVTPLLVGLMMNAHGAAGGPNLSLGTIKDIVLQILVPFFAGQALRPWIGAFVTKHKPILGYVDRGSILVVVYVAFSEGVVAGIWHRISLFSLFALIGLNIVLFAVVLAVSTFTARRLKFSKEDEIAIVFCGSKKSLASGLPMASVLFPAPQVGLIVLPLMLFHQIQLMACAVLANRYRERLGTE